MSDTLTGDAIGWFDATCGGALIWEITIKLPIKCKHLVSTVKNIFKNITLICVVDLQKKK